MTGGAYQWSTSKNHRLNTISALDLGSRDIVDPNAQYGDEDFLIVGMDSRAGDNGNMDVGTTEDADGARSDTMMLVNIPANRKRVVAVSFPRDLAITPIQCEAWNPTPAKYGPLYDADTKKWGPRNGLHRDEAELGFLLRRAEVSGEGNPEAVRVEHQPLHRRRFRRLREMVDALGGVEVCSTTPLKDYELGTVLAHSGRQLLDSPTALNYVRARNVTTENNGDYGRIKRQQLFLSSLLRSLISKETFFYLSKLNSVVDMFISNSYVDNVKTRDLVQLGQSVQGMNAGHVTFVTVPTGVTDENGDEPPRTADMRALFDRSSTTTRCRRKTTITRHLGPPTSSANAQSPTYQEAAQPAPTRTPSICRPYADRAAERHRAGIQLHLASPGLATTASNQLKRSGFRCQVARRLPEPAEIHDGVVLARQRGGRGHGCGGLRELQSRADHRNRTRRAGGARLGLHLGRRSPAERVTRQLAGRAQQDQLADQTPGRPVGHQRRRHSLRVRPPRICWSTRDSWQVHAALRAVHAVADSESTLEDMRTAYHEQLSELSEQLGAMCGLAGAAMERATQALLQADLVVAEQVISDHEKIAELSAQAEESAFVLLALQAPVAGDLRSIVSAIQMVADIDRMGALALHVAKIARRRHPQHTLPEEVNGYFAEMGRLAVELGNSAQEVLWSRDPEKAARIREEDDAMDDLHRHLFTVLMDREWKHGVAAAVDVTLLGRFYERFADHAVEVARRVIFQATGRFPEDEAVAQSG